MDTDPRIAKCLEAADRARWDAVPHLYLNQNDVDKGRPVETADPVGAFAGMDDGVLELNGSWQAGGKIGVIMSAYFDRFEFSVEATPDEINDQLKQKMKPRIAQW